MCSTWIIYVKTSVHIQHNISLLSGTLINFQCLELSFKRLCMFNNLILSWWSIWSCKTQKVETKCSNCKPLYNKTCRLPNTLKINANYSEPVLLGKGFFTFMNMLCIYCTIKIHICLIFIKLLNLGMSFYRNYSRRLKFPICGLI